MIFYVFLLLLLIYTVSATHCRKELNYHEDYGYGYDIYCDNLDDTNMHEMESVFVYNEIVIDIRNSNLTLRRVNIFKNLTKVKELIINNTIVNNFQEPVFEHLTLLEMLTINNNNYTTVYAHTLSGLKSVKTLDLCRNRFQVFEKTSLQHLEDLEVLNLDDNRIDSVDRIPLCEAPLLREIYINRNRIQSLNASAFDCLTNMETLSLNSNGIKVISGAFSVKFLSSLFLYDNELKSIQKMFKGMMNLKHLDLRKNNLRKIDAGTLNLCMLEELLLADNYFTVIDSEVFRNSTSVKSLDLSNNRVSTLNVSLLTNLHDIDLSNNRLTKVTRALFKKLYYLKSIDLSQNVIEVIDDYSFENLQMLKSLNVSSNRISALSKNTFSGLQLLTNLNLRHNNISEINDQFLSFVSNLKTLDLAENKLRFFTNTTFHKMIYLETLNISYNKAEQLDSNVLTHLINLRVLDVKSNFLKTLDYRIILNDLPMLQIINLNLNLFTCDFLTNMVAYLEEKYITYSDHESINYDKENVKGIYCKESGGNDIKNEALINQLYNLTKSSKDIYENKLNETILILVMSLLLLFSIVGVGLYKFTLYIKRRDYLTDELELIEK